MEVNLRKDRFLERLFSWSLDVWLKFKNSYYDDSWRYENGTNLCHFIRVITV